MKKFLLGVCTALIANSSFAQNFTVVYGDTATGTLTSGYSSVTVPNDIINNTTSAQTYSWKGIDSNYPSGWSFGGMCDNNNCYNNGVLDGSALHESAAVQSGDTLIMHTDFNDDGTAAKNSTAWVRISLYETASGVSSSKTLTFMATKNFSTGISVVKSEDDIVLYPNPATNTVNLIYDASLAVKNIGVYNLIGKMVSIYKTTTNNSAKLDGIDRLPSGIYFVRLFDAQGNVVATRKFTHQ